MGSALRLRALNRDFDPERVEGPSLTDIQESIAQLDGKTKTILMLEIDADYHMGIGGGSGGQYVVYMTSDNLHFKNLIAPEKSGPNVRLMCGGQEGDFSAKQCIDLPRVLRAAEAFAKTGQPDPALVWEDG